MDVVVYGCIKNIWEALRNSRKQLTGDLPLNHPHRLLIGSYILVVPAH